MGTKRVGLARTQALLENLKRSLGLSGTTMTGMTLSNGTANSCTISGDSNVTGGGIMGIAYSDAYTVLQQTAAQSVQVTIPANAMILDCGIKVTSQIGGTGTLKMGFGTDTSDFSIVAEKTVCDSGSTMAAGAMQSAVAQNKGDASGAAFGGLEGGVVLWRSASDIIFLTITASSASTTAGELVAWVKYAIVDISS
jgi:hypothetical protein